MEIKYLVTLCGIGDIGHQVDLPACSASGTLATRTIPAILRDAMPEHIDQQARGFPAGL